MKTWSWEEALRRFDLFLRAERGLSQHTARAFDRMYTLMAGGSR